MFLEGNLFIEIELGEYLKKLAIFGGIQVASLLAIRVHLGKTPKKYTQAMFEETTYKLIEKLGSISGSLFLFALTIIFGAFLIVVLGVFGIISYSMAVFLFYITLTLAGVSTIIIITAAVIQLTYKIILFDMELEEYIIAITDYLEEIIEKYGRIREKVVKGEAPIHTMEKISMELHYVVSTLEEYLNYYLKEQFGIPSYIYMRDKLLYLITEYFVSIKSQQEREVIEEKIKNFLRGIKDALSKRSKIRDLPSLIMNFVKENEEIPAYVDTDIEISNEEPMKEKMQSIFASVITFVFSLIFSNPESWSIMLQILTRFSIVILYLIFVGIIILTIVSNMFSSMSICIEHARKYAYLTFMSRLRRPRKKRRRI